MTLGQDCLFSGSLRPPCRLSWTDDTAIPSPSSAHTSAAGFVTLPCRGREVSVPQELSGRSDCLAPRAHRRGAKRAMRPG